MKTLNFKTTENTIISIVSIMFFLYFFGYAIGQAYAYFIK